MNAVGNENKMNEINFNNINIGINNNNFIIKDNLTRLFNINNNPFKQKDTKCQYSKNINFNNYNLVNVHNIKEDNALVHKNNIQMNTNKRNKSQNSKCFNNAEINNATYIKKYNINNDEIEQNHELFLSDIIPQINKLYDNIKNINYNTYKNNKYGSLNELSNPEKYHSIKDTFDKYSIYNNNSNDNDNKENYNNNLNIEIKQNKEKNLNYIPVNNYINNKNTEGENDSKRKSFDYHKKLENIKTRITDLLNIYDFLLEKKM